MNCEAVPYELELLPDGVVELFLGVAVPEVLFGYKDLTNKDTIVPKKTQIIFSINHKYPVFSPL